MLTKILVIITSADKTPTCVVPFIIDYCPILNLLMSNQSDHPFMRFTLLGFDEDTDIKEPNAISSPGPHSSPSSYHQVHTSEGIQFGNLPELSEADPDSDFHSRFGRFFLNFC